MRWERKGQAGAAVLIVLIAVLIILYVLFLPPAERAQLLGENPDGSPIGGGENPGPNNVLYSAAPATNVQVPPVVRQIPPFTIRTLTAGNILAQRSGLTVARSIFHSDGEVMLFQVPDNAQNMILSFNVLQAMGNLQITLNGNVIFDQAVSQAQPQPILLQNLLPGTNELKFSTSGVGFAFWNTNRYELANILVTGDVTMFQEAAQTTRFTVPDITTVEDAFLRFAPECFRDGGRLTVMLNNQPIYSGIPECGLPLSLDVAPARLNQGENTLDWSVASGEYFVDGATVILEQEQTQSQNSFVISDQLLASVIGQGQDILLQLSFTQQGAQGVVVVNGNQLGFRTVQQTFAAPITQYIRSGSNTISIADSSSSVVLLEVLHG